MQNQVLPLQNPHFKGQSGNALWFILVAIALLAALTFALTQNSSKTSDNLSTEQARIVAQQTMRDFNEYTQGIQKLTSMHNCSESQISFENTFIDPGSIYFNPKSPLDHRCHMFLPEGAGLVRRSAPAGLLDRSKTAGDTRWTVVGNLSVNGVGPEKEDESTCATNCAEMVMGTQYIDPEVCRQYNQLLKLNSGQPVAGGGNVDWTTYYVGEFSNGTGGSEKIYEGSGDENSKLYGITSACFYTMQGSYRNHQIYHVLIER